MIRTADAAMGRWPGILNALGIDNAYLVNRHGPCPMCGGKDRYRFDDKDGRGTWYCSGCGAGDGMDLAMRWLAVPFSDAAKRVDELVPRIEPAKPAKAPNARRRIERVARACRPDTGVIAEYLSGRGIVEWPRDLIKLAPQQPYYVDGVEVARYDAMVARLQDAKGKTLTLHMTYLLDGQKAPVDAARKMLPPLCPIPGSAIRLTEVGKTIGVAEGIETALAVMQRGHPCWSSVSAGLMESWVPPAGVERVTVWADNDKTFTGQAAGYSLAKRLHKSGYRVDVRLPAMGTDWADKENH